MKLILPVLFCLLAFRCVAQEQEGYKMPLLTAPTDSVATPTKLDVKYGFRGIKFGTPKASMPGLVPVGLPSEGMQAYKRPGEDMKLAGQPVSSVVWVFYRSRLYAVLVNIRLDADPDKVKALLLEAYGDPTTSEESLSWLGQRATALFSQDEDTMRWSLFLKSEIISRQKDAHDAALLKSAAEKL